MNDQALQAELIRLFERHDVTLEPDEDWLVTDGDFPAVRATWREGGEGAPGRLDIDVILSEERHIEESFAGRGEVGARDALKTFQRDVLHVLLAACWYVTDDRRIQLQSWELGMHSWDAFIGPLSYNRDGLNAPEAWVSGLHDTLRNEFLSGELHWVRLFYRRSEDGSITAEALLDNQPWANGDRWINQLAWPAAEGGYSARCFIALDIRDY